MSLSPPSLPRGTRRKTGVLPSPRPRGRDLPAQPGARACPRRPDEKPSEAFLRRREKYAAAVVLAAAISAALAQTAWAGTLKGDPARGETIYEACQDCHSLDKNDVGPRHRGVFGRKAASLPDYEYSGALKSANITWNEETLDRWLTDPQAMVPGAKMFFHLDNPQDRADVIAYLKERAK
ncbi:MAG TPA: cytochrome c family protein [Roseiarcus sp.]|nr:cytochrome c family protein [Roseiarcus sp.]